MRTATIVVVRIGVVRRWLRWLRLRRWCLRLRLGGWVLPWRRILTRRWLLRLVLRRDRWILRLRLGARIGPRRRLLRLGDRVSLLLTDVCRRRDAKDRR